MNFYFILSVFIMAIFTYLPRMIPLTFYRKEITSPFIRSLLHYIPYAVLSALTFPSIFYSTGHVYSSFVGCLVGIYFAYREKGLVFVAITSMATAYLMNFIC